MVNTHAGNTFTMAMGNNCAARNYLIRYLIMPPDLEQSAI